MHPRNQKNLVQLDYQGLESNRLHDDDYHQGLRNQGQWSQCPPSSQSLVLYHCGHLCNAHSKY